MDAEKKTMPETTQVEIGIVAALWRYPVKSMMGDELQNAQVTDHGLIGDRAYALIDSVDGKVATAKNPGKWPRLFACGLPFWNCQGVMAMRRRSVSRCSMARPSPARNRTAIRCSPQLSRARFLSRPDNRHAVVTSAFLDGKVRRVLARSRRPRAPGHHHRVCFAGVHIF